MPLKPIDKRSALETREAIWKLIRAMKSFTVADLYGHTRCSRDTIKDYLCGLINADYVESDGHGTYTLNRDTGVDAPRVRRDGSVVTQGRGRENMWRVMKVLGEFTFRDLALHASTDDVRVAEAEARDYCINLHKAGYLTVIIPGKPGSPHSPGNPARYRLLPSRWTGPKAPMVQRVHQIYDPNTKTVVWKGGTRDEH